MTVRQHNRATHCYGNDNRVECKKRNHVGKVIAMKAGGSDGRVHSHEKWDHARVVMDGTLYVPGDASEGWEAQVVGNRGGILVWDPTDKSRLTISEEFRPKLAHAFDKIFNNPAPPLAHVYLAIGQPSAENYRLLDDVINMARSVSALGPAIAALDVETSPPLASAIQATENLWMSVGRRWGLLRSTEVAELLGAKTGNRSFASNLRKNGKLIGVERANAYLYPGFQFDRQSGTVHEIIPKLVRAARTEGVDDEDLIFWLCSPSRYFDDDLPVEHLLDDPDIVEKFTASETISW